MKVKRSLQPTYENVTKEFIPNSLHDIMYNEDNEQFANFLIDFKEAEAIEFIKNTYNKSLNWHSRNTKSFMQRFLEEIISGINKAKNNDTDYPVMEVSDYKLFFENLRKVYEQDIKLFSQKRSDLTSFSPYERYNLFTQIWLRCTPEDFKHPEQFLEKSAQMMSDDTFKEFDEQKKIGNVSAFDNNILYAKNEIANTWDEESREFQFRVYSKDIYNDFGIYEFPLIRYGIFNQNGEKICQIGSIQNKAMDKSKLSFSETIDKNRKEVNRGVPGEEKKEIEPKKVIALSMFINLLHQKGISKIQVPSMYVLDYNYHEKRVKYVIKQFEKHWPEYRRKKEPEIYMQEKQICEDLKGYEDFISKTKTENFIRLFSRILYHYPNGKITNYPGEVDNTMHIEIPIVKDKQEINGKFLQELYEVINSREKENFKYER